MSDHCYPSAYRAERVLSSLGRRAGGGRPEVVRAITQQPLMIEGSYLVCDIIMTSSCS